MGFVDATKAFFSNYVNFKDRSSRSEYWWPQLAIFIGLVVVVLLGGLLGETLGGLLISIAYLAIIIPSIAVGIRRLHDLDKSGWFYLLALVPFVSLVLLFWFCQKGTTGSNTYGSDPLGSDSAVFN